MKNLGAPLQVYKLNIRQVKLVPIRWRDYAFERYGVTLMSRVPCSTYTSQTASHLVGNDDVWYHKLRTTWRIIESTTPTWVQNINRLTVCWPLTLNLSFCPGWNIISSWAKRFSLSPVEQTTVVCCRQELPDTWNLTTISTDLASTAFGTSRRSLLIISHSSTSRWSHLTSTTL